MIAIVLIAKSAPFADNKETTETMKQLEQCTKLKNKELSFMARVTNCIIELKSQQSGTV